MTWADAAAIARRWWWVFVVVTLAISLFSLIGWLRTPPVYVATRTVYVAVVPPGMPTNQASYLAQQRAQAAARTVASPRFLTAPAYDRAVSHALAPSSDPSLRDASSLKLGQALSGSNSGTGITLTATWTSASGAESLASAAANALATGNPDVLALFEGSDYMQRFVADPQTSPAVRDPASTAAARDRLLTRLALSLLAGLLVMAAVGLLERWQVGSGAARWGGLRQAE